MLHIDDIKKIRLYRQHLTNKTDKQTAVRDLNGFQAQFTVNALHSLKIRCSDLVTEENFGDGLVKNWTVRGTVHVFSEKDLPVFIRKNYRSDDWSIPSWWNGRPGWSLTASRQKYFSDIILESLKESSKTRDELKALCRQNGMTESEEGSMFDPWGGGIRELCERGFMNYAVQETKAYELCSVYVPMSDDEAEAELMKRYFENFAPATVRDAAYYFGYTQIKTKTVMKKLPLESFTVDGTEYFYMGKVPSGIPEIPKCILLAGFDQLMLGYKKEESLFLPKDHLRGIFNLAGIVMPAILLDGRVVGRWKHKNGKMTFELFEPISEKDKKTVEETASMCFQIKTTDFSYI